MEYLILTENFFIHEKVCSDIRDKLTKIEFEEKLNIQDDEKWMDINKYLDVKIKEAIRMYLEYIDTNSGKIDDSYAYVRNILGTLDKIEYHIEKVNSSTCNKWKNDQTETNRKLSFIIDLQSVNTSVGGNLIFKSFPNNLDNMFGIITGNITIYPSLWPYMNRFNKLLNPDHTRYIIKGYISSSSNV